MTGISSGQPGCAEGRGPVPAARHHPLDRHLPASRAYRFVAYPSAGAGLPAASRPAAGRTRTGPKR
ncbi:hypothetical protein O7626_09020 [Micromonospora sp. WMMD1102]|uniref:hypothetical protein n=1 Tax=Micromonospora sp. WMMD1102 TaxID=3016105 RepID=UPI0024156643|nr:hypothetical protein [Micromonospora sp. WMMD1102]MDG4786064.1 hypothetical protein [Micromonospora sp. WMMD1102]